tara:strand:- start:3974 stop:4516 length:543 start_codon:yes stop_codon:yes gene_type:complete
MKYKDYFKEADKRKGMSPAAIAKHKDKQRSKQDLANKSRQHGAMRDQGYRWDKETMQWVHEDKAGRKGYTDTNPDLEEAIMDILIKFEQQNIKHGITYWRFKNADVVAELDKDTVYGINGTNPWLAEPKSKERAVAKIRAEWGLVDPNRGDARTGVTQKHKSGHTQSPLLKPTEPETDDI